MPPRIGGSSPLTRGKQVLVVAAQFSVRLIPAHAGKTSGYPAIGGQQAAHPRSRGENHRVLPRLPSADGSSPLTRGKRFSTCVLAASARLIPAHAGKTYRSLQRTPIRRAHPRSRGENSPRPSSLPLKSGSSPLTRGKLRSGLGSAASARLIPAHAGKTRHGSDAR